MQAKLYLGFNPFLAFTTVSPLEDNSVLSPFVFHCEKEQSFQTSPIHPPRPSSGPASSIAYLRFSLAASRGGGGKEGVARPLKINRFQFHPRIVIPSQTGFVP